MSSAALNKMQPATQALSGCAMGLLAGLQVELVEALC
jgi:hypothetical protein